MTVTEKDAKFLFCPLLTTPEGKMRFCQGAQCMMWRWSGEGDGPDSVGFCGLACAPVTASRAARTGGFLSSGPKQGPENPFE